MINALHGNLILGELIEKLINTSVIDWLLVTTLQEVTSQITDHKNGLLAVPLYHYIIYRQSLVLLQQDSRFPFP